MKEPPRAFYNNSTTVVQYNISGRAMTEFARSRSTVDDTDLLCVEVSGLGAGSSTLPRVSCGGGWHQFPSTVARTISSTDHTQEDFLSSLLLKTDAYRPRQQSLERMQDTGDESYYRYYNIIVSTNKVVVVDADTPCLSTKCCRPSTGFEYYRLRWLATGSSWFRLNPR